MKIIGIMGNGGSGKTSFADALASKKSVGIIHVDDLVGNVKRKYFKLFLQPNKNNTTESTEKNPKLKSGTKQAFYKNKITFNLLMKIRSMLVYPQIEELLSEFKKEGKELVVIDDWVLSTHKKLMGKINHIYMLDRNYFARRSGMKQRDDLSLKELKVSDLPYALGFVKIPQGDNVTHINNNGSLEELQEIARGECSKYIAPTFDERYKIEPSTLAPVNLTKLMSSVKNYSKQSRRKE